MAAISHVKSNTIGDFTGTVTVFNSAGATTQASATDLVRPVDWNSAHAQNWSISGNTGGDASSSAGATNIVFGATNGMEIYASTAANAVTLWLDNDGRPLRVYEPTPYSSGTAWSSHNPASTYFQYMSLPEPLNFNFAYVPKSVSFAVPAGTSSNTTQTFRHGYTHYFSLFSRKNTGASSNSLTYMTHGSLVVTHSFVHSSTSMRVSMSYNTNSTGGTTDQTVSSNATANIAAYFSGGRMMKIPFPATTLQAGEYWIAQAHSTSQAATSATNTTCMLYSNLHQVPTAAPNLAWFGVTNATSSSLNAFAVASRGVVSALTSNADFNGSVISGSAANNWYCVLAQF